VDFCNDREPYYEGGGARYYRAFNCWFSFEGREAWKAATPGTLLPHRAFPNGMQLLRVVSHIPELRRKLRLAWTVMHCIVSFFFLFLACCCQSPFCTFAKKKKKKKKNVIPVLAKASPYGFAAHAEVCHPDLRPRPFLAFEVTGIFQ